MPALVRSDQPGSDAASRTGCVRRTVAGANDEPGMNTLGPEHGAHDGCQVLTDAGPGSPGTINVGENEHRQIIQILPMFIDILTQLRYFSIVLSDRLLPEHFNDIEVVIEVTLKLLLKLH